jgi:hypothetical protein
MEEAPPSLARAVLPTSRDRGFELINLTFTAAPGLNEGPWLQIITSGNKNMGLHCIIFWVHIRCNEAVGMNLGNLRQ